MYTGTLFLSFLQLIASEDKYIRFLLTLCDFAMEHRFNPLRDTVRNLLKLLPTGIQLLSSTLDHCRESSELIESGAAYDKLRRHIVTSSVSTTLYHLEVLGGGGRGRLAVSTDFIHCPHMLPLTTII